MHVISLYLVLHTYTPIFDVMCVKKTEATKRDLRNIDSPLAVGPQAHPPTCPQ
jgi:hypothetical protein